MKTSKNQIQMDRKAAIKATSCLAAIGLFLCSAQAQESESVIADFEGADYGAWVVTGTAFGNSPAHGALPNQMSVDGFRGNGFASSYHGGDDAVGTLTSPAFKLEHKYLQFLIGGGAWAGKTCMNLLLDGKVVRTATGTNTKQGGSEHLDVQQWDVSELLGKFVVLQIVDQATSGWGHLSVDQIVQSDHKIPGLIVLTDVTRSLQAEKSYLNLPVKTGAPMRRVSVLVDGKPQREFDIELAEDKPDFWAFMDLVPFKGQQITLKVNKLPEESKGLQSIEQSDQIHDLKGLYNEPLRPQFHFTSRCGWLNDPNGLVFFEGEYHLFYQHNPYGWNWGNMHWGHAVSADLVHWKELPAALYPDDGGTMFSGSAVVDWNNTAGFQTGKEEALVAMFTDAGKPFTQGIAYSNDRGRTWTKYEHNPVIKNIIGENRDPKVIWYAPGKKWVMALFLDRNTYALFSSPNLKEWTKMSEITVPNESECPEFFEIAVDGNKQDTRWVFYGANGLYLVGTFDGTTFKPEAPAQALQHGNVWYASQTYTDIPKSDGRRILVPWARGSDFHQSGFNQMMGIPVELTLHTTEAGLRLAAAPVKELQSLRGKSHDLKAQTLSPGQNPLADLSGELLDLTTEITLDQALSIVFTLHGMPVTYDVAKQELSCNGRKGPLKAIGGKISLRLLVDRTSIDIFGNDGSLYMPMGVTFPKDNQTLSMGVVGGNAQINSLKVYELMSAWEKN